MKRPNQSSSSPPIARSTSLGFQEVVGHGKTMPIGLPEKMGFVGTIVGAWSLTVG